jgi:hypothetical protein
MVRTSTLPPLQEKAAEILWLIDQLLEIFPHLSIASIQSAAGVSNMSVARLRDGQGVNYETLQKLDAYLHEQIAAFGEFSARVKAYVPSAAAVQ